MSDPKSLPDVGGILMPGWIQYMPVECNAGHGYWDKLTDGGIALPDAAKTGDNERNRCLFGQVTQCSIVFCEHQGRHLSPEEIHRQGVHVWPLPRGTWITLRDAAPWKVAPKVFQLNTRDIINCWYPPELRKQLRKTIPAEIVNEAFEALFGPPDWALTAEQYVAKMKATR